MNNPTASKQYVFPLSFGPADITTGSFLSDNGYTVHYSKLGNFYYGFWISNGFGSRFGIGYDTLGGAGGITLIEATLAHFAVAIGVTINTYYASSQTMNATGSTGTFYTWNGINNYINSSGNSNNVAVGFLSN